MPTIRRPEQVAPVPATVRPLIRPVFDAEGKLLGRIWYLAGREHWEARRR
jgi:hypothetical protein